jgi:hypothetical protein
LKLTAPGSRGGELQFFFHKKSLGMTLRAFLHILTFIAIKRYLDLKIPKLFNLLLKPIMECFV